jgi:hypothetical protein
VQAMNEVLLLLGQQAPAPDPVFTLLETDKFIPALAIVGGLGCVTIWIFMHYFYSWIELTQNNKIKLRMIESGHSAEEIEQVICAGKEPDDQENPKRRTKNAFSVPPAKPIPQHVA